MSESTSDVSLHFLDYWRVIRNRAALIATIFLLTLISGYVTTVYYLVKVYSAKTEIKVQKKEKDIGVFSPSGEYGFDPVFFQSELEIIQSKKTLYKVIEKLELNKIWAKRLFGSEQPLKLDQAYGYLKGRGLEVDVKRGSSILEITAYSDLPEEAEQIANTVAEVYMESRKSDANFKIGRGLTGLNLQVEEQKKAVEAAKAKVEDIRKAMNEVSGTQGTQQIDIELGRKAGLLDEARADLNTRTIRYRELQKLPFEKLIDALAAFDLAGEAIGLRSQQMAMEAEIARLKNNGYGSSHPEVVSKQATAEKISEQVKSMVEGKLKALAIEVEVSKSRVDQIDKEVKDLNDRVNAQKKDIVVPYQEAKSEQDRQQNILDVLNLRYKQESVDKEVDGEPVTLISKAEASDSPVKPNLRLNLILSGAVGMVLGLALAFFIEYLDTSVKTMNDVEKFIGLPVLSVIPKGISTLNIEGPDSPNAEPYRILRAKIHLTPAASMGTTMTVVSGGPGEGKSTTLFNLAYVSAQSGQSVLLIDADLRRPTVHRIMGIANNFGLADYLLGNNDLDSLVQVTEVPNLHILTAGTIDSDKIGAFSARKLQELLDLVRQRYDVILVDSPPVLGISDASVISHAVDATLLVIQHRRYPRDIALRAKRAINEIRGNLVGVVLNAVTIKSDEAYYYYSSYGSYYNAGDKKSRKARDAAIAVKVERQKAIIKQANGNGSDSF